MPNGCRCVRTVLSQRLHRDKMAKAVKCKRANNRITQVNKTFICKDKRFFGERNILAQTLTNSKVHSYPWSWCLCVCGEATDDRPLTLFLFQSGSWVQRHWSECSRNGGSLHTMLHLEPGAGGKKAENDGLHSAHCTTRLPVIVECVIRLLTGQYSDCGDPESAWGIICGIHSSQLRSQLEKLWMQRKKRIRTQINGFVLQNGNTENRVAVCNHVACWLARIYCSWSNKLFERKWKWQRKMNAVRE